eukprot:4184254-Pleurochrysis_carterae.AAC.1
MVAARAAARSGVHRRARGTRGYAGLARAEGLMAAGRRLAALMDTGHRRRRQQGLEWCSLESQVCESATAGRREHGTMRANAARARGRRCGSAIWRDGG